MTHSLLLGILKELRKTRSAINTLIKIEKDRDFRKHLETLSHAENCRVNLFQHQRKVE